MATSGMMEAKLGDKAGVNILPITMVIFVLVDHKPLKSAANNIEHMISL